MKKFYLIFLIVPAIINSCSVWGPINKDIHNLNEGNVGIGTNAPDSKLTVVDLSDQPIKNYTGFSSKISSPGQARAVFGAAINEKGTSNYGGYFTAAGESSGVFGEASDTINGYAGGVFHSYGERGIGVLGLAANTVTNMANYGGWFDSRGVNGVGIYARGGQTGYAAVFNGNVKIIKNGKNIMELGDGLDFAEGFSTSYSPSNQISPGMVMVIDINKTGELTISNKPYDNCVVGVVAGANGLNSGIKLGYAGFDVYVGLVGRVYCNVDASGEEIKPGDLLTTSSIPGYAMKAIDRSKADGAIIGKALEPLEKGKRGQILILISLQ